MPQPSLGTLETKALRDIWKHEERDFTPWLAQNIDRLSQLLGVPIAVDQTEHKVGAYELDILGRVEESNTVVIVENQLTTTDHGHLGQLITYAAGLEAAIIVWVAADIRDEHRAAVEWLNHNTVEGVSFFLVRPEAFAIDGSKPAVRLTLEAAPSEFARRLRGIKDFEDKPRNELRRKFWEGLYTYLAEDGHPWAKGRSTTRDSWIASPVGKGGISCNVSFAQDSRIRVEIYLSSDSAKNQFDALFAHKAEIDDRLSGEDVSWERLEDAVAARVAVYRGYDRDKVAEDTPERQALFAWISKCLMILRAITKQHLHEL